MLSNAENLLVFVFYGFTALQVEQEQACHIDCFSESRVV
uniref:Uncharacterized protein n=1 Tax=Anguilla anguilla TaxID=7936 RepID=A0A0E9XSE7_ANGAN